VADRGPIEDLSLLLSRDDARLLALELSGFRPDRFNAKQRVVPAPFEVAATAGSGVALLIAPFGEGSSYSARSMRMCH